ncbi:MAG: hypothetical protein JXM73_10290 [Anaerolineae bacterium]|nr:hypothetical protein [Anaerolineae bacterium]
MTDLDTSCLNEVERILAADLPDLEKVAQAFGCITAFVAGHAQAEIEIARALQDREELLKTQIKKETVIYARSIFEHCYRRVTGRRPWHETA